MRKTREHSVVLARVMAFLGHFAWMRKFVSFFGNVKKLCFASDSVMPTDIDICGHMTT